MRDLETGKRETPKQARERLRKEQLGKPHARALQVFFCEPTSSQVVAWLMDIVWGADPFEKPAFEAFALMRDFLATAAGLEVARWLGETVGLAILAGKDGAEPGLYACGYARGRRDLARALVGRAGPTIAFTWLEPTLFGAGYQQGTKDLAQLILSYGQKLKDTIIPERTVP